MDEHGEVRGGRKDGGADADGEDGGDGGLAVVGEVEDRDETGSHAVLAHGASTQDAIRLLSDVLDDLPSVLFHVTSDAHCLCCDVLEDPHGLFLNVTTGYRSSLLYSVRVARSGPLPILSARLTMSTPELIE